MNAKNLGKSLVLVLTMAGGTAWAQVAELYDAVEAALKN